MNPNAGKKRGTRKLIMAEVQFIRQMDESGGMSRKEMAKKFGMNPESLARVCRGETYPETELKETYETETFAVDERLLAEQAIRLQQVQRDGQERQERLESFYAGTKGKTAQEIQEEATREIDALEASKRAQLPVVGE